MVDGWKYVATTPVVRGLVIGIVGAFAAGGVVIGLARTFVADLGGGDPGYGVLFGTVFLGLGLGMWVGPRLLRGLSRRRLFGLSLTTTGLLLFPLALQQLEIVTAVTLVLGFFAGVAWITGNTLLGLEVPDEVRGRTFAFVGSMIRLSLALVLAAAPLIAGTIGTPELPFKDSDGDQLLVYHGAAITFLIAAVLMTTVGVTAYRQMDDRKGISLVTDLRHSFSGTLGVYAATGCFVALEGGEGAGKSTQARLLEQWLRAEGYDVLVTHEPGDTEVGQKLRKIVLDPATGDISHRTEALLYAADKAEHVDTVVAPALARGAVVVTDRYVDSTLAYQGAGRDLADREVERIARWATSDLRPNLTVVLDLPPQPGWPASRSATASRGSRWTSTSGSATCSCSWPRARRSTTSSSTPAPRSTRSPPGSRARLEPLLEAARRHQPERAAGEAPPAAATTPETDGAAREHTQTPSTGPPRSPTRSPRSWTTGASRERRRRRGRLRLVDAGRAAPRRRHAHAGGGRAGHDPRLAVHRPARLGPSNAALAFAAALQCLDGGCGHCHACQTALAGTPPRRQRHPVRDLGALHRRHARPGAPLRALPGGEALAGDGDRGRRPARRAHRQHPAQGDRGADPQDGVAAVRAHPRGRPPDDPLPEPATSP